MVPQNYQKLETPEHVALMEKLIDIMEDDDDVQNIWHNWEEQNKSTKLQISTRFQVFYELFNTV